MNRASLATGAVVVIAALGCSDRPHPGVDRGGGGSGGIDFDLGGADGGGSGAGGSDLGGAGGGGSGAGGSDSGGAGVAFVECPTQSPVPVGARCSGWSSCTIGSQVCCSHTEPVAVVSCVAGKITTQFWESGCLLGVRCVESLGVCGSAGSGRECGATSSCVQGCAPAGQSDGICSVPGREAFGCGGAAQRCTTAGLTCLMPSCCDHQGLCVTASERQTVCSGPMAARFDCSRDGGAD